MSFLTMLTLLFAGLAVVAAVLMFRSFGAGNWGRGSLGLVVTVVLLGLSAVGGALSIATSGYRALTREETAAVVEVRPLSDRDHAFEATVEIPGKPTRTYEVRGDQLYVDAQIVKWEPMVNVLGLHTAYELDRLGGRYRDDEMAENGPRTVHSLGQERFVEIAGLLERLPLLERMVDAEYGSGTFVEVDRPRRLEVRVSTSGLLIREADKN